MSYTYNWFVQFHHTVMFYKRFSHSLCRLFSMFALKINIFPKRMVMLNNTTGFTHCQSPLSTVCMSSSAFIIHSLSCICILVQKSATRGQHQYIWIHYSISSVHWRRFYTLYMSLTRLPYLSAMLNCWMRTLTNHNLRYTVQLIIRRFSWVLTSFSCM